MVYGLPDYEVNRAKFNRHGAHCSYVRTVDKSNAGLTMMANRFVNSTDRNEKGSDKWLGKR